MVGRPREFDVDVVLDAAMRAFWTNGYEATTLNDLMAATGLHKGSIYQAFGDKHALFTEALKRYLEEMRRHNKEVLTQAATPLEGLRNVAHAMIEMLDDDPKCPRGCMAINALVEKAPSDAEVQRILGEHYDVVRRVIEATVARAQAEGQIRRDRTPAVITALMMTFMSGLGTQLRGHMSKIEAHKLLDKQFEMLL